MDRDQRQQLQTIAADVASWVHQARSVLTRCAKVDEAADDAVGALRRAVIDACSDSAVEWRVLPLTSGDSSLLGQVARQMQQPPLTADERKALDQLTADGARALHDVKSVVGARRFFSGSKKRETGQAAAEFLIQVRAWGTASGLPQLLQRVDKQDDTSTDVSVANALADWVGLRSRLTDLGSSPEIIAATTLSRLPSSIKTIDQALKDEAQFRAGVVVAASAVRQREVGRLVSQMPVERLKDATRDRLRVGPLSAAGITTVQAVLDRGASLEHLPGIGATSATRMRGAAQTLWQTTYDEMPVRVDIKHRTSEATELLRRLRAWDAMRKTKNATTDLWRAAALTPLATALNGNVSHLVVFPVGSQLAEFHDAVEALGRRAQLISATNATRSTGDPWDDFLDRPADYFAMLAELGFITEDEQKTHGDLPDDIVDAVRTFELNTEHLSASLRGYQHFGARFALVQRKVIIGDEMGLGKTVEALAVLAHLRATGSHHSLVICPAAVVTNWVREIGSKSTLRAHRVHGPGRAAAARNWIRNGGVAVTTFETLAWFESPVTTVRDLGCVVIDEAHYIKNPTALRTRRATRVLDACERAILLTGTPLENRIEELGNLVAYLRPDLVVDANELAPRRFRRQVAPAYLRRNQEDVLTELPEVVEVDEWLPMSNEDAVAGSSQLRV